MSATASAPCSDDVLTEIGDQHTRLHAQIEKCFVQAERFARGDACTSELTHTVIQLRLLLQEHNSYEERVLPLLLESAEGGAPGALVRDQVAEHLALASGLYDMTATALRTSLERLRSHLVFEETLFIRLRSAQLTRRARR
jgi:hypothetical protein